MALLDRAKEEVRAEIYEVEVIRASVREVFEAMTNARIIDEWGAGPSRFQARPGGKFFLWDGEMFGMVCEVQAPVRIVYTLREEWWDPEWKDSMVCWTLKEVDRGTELTLAHSGLPGRKVREAHREGWGEYFLGPMKAYLEYSRS
ncbi:MAG: SRPBCC domain-containing protein [Leptospiraceae bacterium]|nr:SRPBCC domain-containing protein [Leptospiraceae bacterium]